MAAAGLMTAKFMGNARMRIIQYYIRVPREISSEFEELLRIVNL